MLEFVTLWLTGSCAARAGLNVGDALVTIDGKNIAAASVEEVIDIIKQSKFISTTRVVHLGLFVCLFVCLSINVCNSKTVAPINLFFTQEI